MNKIIGFLEAQVEKIVLAIVGLVCVWILLHYVILGPNKVEYDSEKLSPGEVDMEISRKAELLRQKLSEPPKATEESYMSLLNGPIAPNNPVMKGIYGGLQDGFIGLFDSPLGNVDTNLYPPIPGRSSLEARFAGEYSLPFVGEVNDVAVEHIRAVAYVPTISVDEQNDYERNNSEPNDIDLVTVEGKLDVSGLYARFQDCFVGEAVKKEEWRDPCLAKPVFAAVQLQRQELNSDGTWGDWENVPRAKIDPYKELFEVIEDVRDLPPGGLTVRMLRFDNPDVRMDLLQPEPYMIASANEEWFPPTLHSKYLEQQRQKAIEERREALEKAREEREKELAGRVDERRSSGRGGDTRSSGRSSMGGEYGGLSGGVGSRPGSSSPRDSSRRTTRRGRSSTADTRRASDRTASSTERLFRQNEGDISTRASKDSSEENVYDKLDAIMISPRTELAKMSEPLVFWAYDDTVEPKKSYRYRIRLGVFNPIAGTNQFSEQDKSHKNDVILWSELSDETEVVDIPGRAYFFASDIQKAAKVVTVEVCKYALGYWYSERFSVKQGEVIGKVEPVELKGEEQQPGVIVPEMIDYGTGAVFVDCFAVNDWSGGRKLVARDYYDMLYSCDGVSIEHMPVKTMNWSRETQGVYRDIQKSIRAEKEPLRDWGSVKGERRRRVPGTESGLDYYEEILKRSTGGGGGRR